MDAFSLAISIGTLSMPLKSGLILSTVVGLFHFFMPFIGCVCSLIILGHVHLDMHLLSGIIFLYIGVQMIKEFKEREKVGFSKSLVGFLFFALGVSLDSFGVGMTLQFNIKLLIYLIIFALFSFSFTLIGLYIGGISHKLLGRYATLIGAFIMIFLAIINFVNFCNF